MNAKQKNMSFPALPTRAVGKVKNLHLKGFIGNTLADNLKNWQLTALKDNPNILEIIERATQKKLCFQEIFGVPFGAEKYSESRLCAQNHAFGNKSVEFFFKEATHVFHDKEIVIAKDPSCNTDVRGAEELWWHIDTSQFKDGGVYARLMFEGCDATTNARGYQRPIPGTGAFLLSDGKSERTIAKIDKEGCVMLPAGFVGWICYLLDKAHFQSCWHENARVARFTDVYRFQFRLAVRSDYVGKAAYIAAFALVGDRLESQNGVQAPPSDIPALSAKQFRILWSPDNLQDEKISSDGNLVAWYGEFIGKFLTGLVFNYQLNENPALREEIVKIIDRIENTQDENGYLGAYINERERFGIGADSWDMWNHYHLCYGLCCWYLVSGERRALTIVTRALDYMLDYLNRHNGGKLRPPFSPTMNLAASHIFALMYKITQKQTYLNACERMLNEGWKLESGSNWYRDALQGKEFFRFELHRWEALHPIMMLSVLYEITGKPDYFKAFEHIWQSIRRTDRHNTGAFSSGEGAQGTPYLSGPGAEIETCCTVAWQALTAEYLQMSKNMLAADELELSYFNAMLGSLVGGDRKDGKRNKYVTYNTPMEGKHDPTALYDGRKIDSPTDIAFQYNAGSPDFNCCQANSARGLGELSQWSVITDEKAVYVNYYGACEAETSTPSGNPLSLKQTTDYPAKGSVRLDVSGLERPEHFILCLRIPSWSKRASVKINGGTVQAAKPGEYFQIDRTWKNGDAIDLEMEISVHFQKGEEGFSGRVSAYYGPILMTLDKKVSPDRNSENTTFCAADFENLTVSDAIKDDHWLYFDVRDDQDNLVRLVDFATCGQYIDGEPGEYSSWLKIADVKYNF